MKWIRRLLGQEPGAAPSPPLLTPPPASPPPPGAPATLKAWDAYGRICEIPREEWRTKVLPLNFRNAWNKPDELAALINNALNDGFIADCLEPARQLSRIDPQPRRGAMYLTVILLQLRQFAEAGKIAGAALRQQGADGVLLTNLAKAQSGLGDEATAERTLWHALEVDPNLDNGVLWYEAIHRERGGESAGQDALRRIAALPGSWRAQLWLARAALQSRQLDAALALHREALARAPQPIPGDLLVQISGDLGNLGHLPEILQLVEPHFEPAAHGLLVGNNLIKAHLDLGQLPAARRILDQLYALNRPDWKQNLNFWDTELAKTRLAVNAADPGKLKFAMLMIDGPVWLKPASPAAELFPARIGERVSVGFLGGTISIATNSQRVERQLSDQPGRLSRALPLFLAEQVEFRSHSRVHTLVPWIMGSNPGFAVSGVPWSDDAAANHARQGETKSDYVVTLHLQPNAEPWSVDLRLIRTIDARCLGTLNGSFPSTQPEAGLPALVEQLLSLLAGQADVECCPAPGLYQVPGQRHLWAYLLRLEQLLAVRCAGMDGLPATFLNGEREIIDGNLQLCLDFPENAGTRILLAQTLLAMKRVRPEILPEFKSKIALLQKEKPLPEPAHSVVQRLFNEALTV